MTILSYQPFSGEVVATAVAAPFGLWGLVRADVPRPADLVHGQAQLRPHHRSHVNGESLQIGSSVTIYAVFLLVGNTVTLLKNAKYGQLQTGNSSGEGVHGAVEVPQAVRGRARL